MKTKKTLRSKLIKVFFIQIGLISLVTLIGIFAAKMTLEDLLVQEALKGEAAHFWAQRAEHANFALPDTQNMMGYLANKPDFSSVPDSLRSLSPGFHTILIDTQSRVVYVNDQQQQRLYLVFDENKVSQLAIVFGVLPLTGVLIVLYLLAWLAYRQSHKAVSPIVQLANAVDEAKVKEGHLPDLDLDELREIRDEEVSTLVRALDQYTQRIELFVERERLFTRDASHELRTPIAVLRTAMALLEKRHQLSEDKITKRIHRTFYDMEALLETLLLLSREQADQLTNQVVDINRLIQEEVDTLTLLFADKQIQVRIEEKKQLKLNAPERVVQIMISNLIRNAYKYTPKGEIALTIHHNGFAVKDSGIGMSSEQANQAFKSFYRADSAVTQQGYGLGLAIVKRLCNRHNWHIRLTSELGEGTEVSVIFPKSQLINKR